MITAKEILGDLDSIISKVKWCVDTFPKNEIWSKIHKELTDVSKSLKKDTKMYNY